jgi:hypothetical protein
MKRSETPSTPNPNLQIKKRLNLILAWCLAAAVEGIAVFILTFTSGSTPTNVWILGLSKVSVGILGFSLGLVLFFSTLAHHFWRNPRSVDRWSGTIERGLRKPWIYGLLVGVSFTLVVLFSQLYHLSGVVSDPYIQGYSVRMQPVMFWLVGLGLQTLVFLPLFRYGLPTKDDTPKSGILRNSGFILVALLLICLVIALTGIGIEPDKVGWDAPGTPITAFQAGLVWVTGVLFLILDAYLKRSSVGGYRKYPLDLFISLLLWVSAFALWAQEPLTRDYFAPEPRAPNYEYYPYSDAALHDLTAQELLIGEGFNGVARKPLYALFLALSHVVAGQNYADVVLFQIAFLAFFPVLIYWLTKGLHHRISGFIAAGLIILREMNAIGLSGEIRVSHAKLLMSDLPAATAIVLITWMLVSWLQDPDKRQYFPFGVGGVIGLLFLLRPQFILLIPAVILLILITFIKRPFRGFISLWLVVLGIVLTLSPWLWRGYQLTGKFTMNDPNQMAFLTQQYHLEPGSEIVTRLPGESEAAFSQRISRYLKDFVFENPGYTTRFITSHFTHNEIEMMLVLPMSFWIVQNPDSDLFPYWLEKFDRLWEECCSLPAYIEASGFWDPIRETIPIKQTLPFLLNLVMISIGLAVVWKRQDIVGLIPLGISIFYSLSTAVGRYSGWRLILPADWVVFLYFSVGMGQITLWLQKFYCNRHKENIEDVDRDSTWNRIKSLPQKMTPPARSGIILAVILLSVGLIPVFVDGLVPQRYDRKSKKVLLVSLSLYGEKEIDHFVADENAVVVEGRALYPRYYRAGEGEPGGGWAAFAERDYDRLGFSLIGAERGGVIMPMEEPPGTFPHASDVIVVGCQNEEFIDAAVIFVDSGNPDETVVFIRPNLNELACPLSTP